MEKIPFSVIMPFYAGDNAKHLGEALGSLKDQTLVADEVVLIQDGPVGDDLQKVVQYWQKELPSIKLIRLERNSGLSAALNAGIEAASCEWLARMDADDVCLPGRFEKQIDLIRKQPSVVLCGSWITEYDYSLEEALAVRKLPATNERILEYARWRCPFNHMTVMYRKSVVQKLGAYKNYGAVGDDYELWARFLMSGYKTANLPESLVKARTGEDFYTARRRGWKYFKNELREINDLYKIGLLNPGHYLFHVAIKSVTRLSPPWMVKLIYSGIRKSSKGE